MNGRLDRTIDEARAALSAAHQDRFADIVAAYVASHAAPADFTDDELAEMKRRHDEPFDPAPEHEVREFFTLPCASVRNGARLPQTRCGATLSP